MAGYAFVFDAIGLRDWWQKKNRLLSLSKLKRVVKNSLLWITSTKLDSPTRDMTAGLEEGFLATVCPRSPGRWMRLCMRKPRWFLVGGWLMLWFRSRSRLQA